jgi:hypothetical protein
LPLTVIVIEIDPPVYSEREGEALIVALYGFYIS